MSELGAGGSARLVWYYPPCDISFDLGKTCVFVLFYAGIQKDQSFLDDQDDQGSR
jgi:hypothetical protein